MRRLNAIHPPKHEIFDLAGGTNTDPKGVVRAVDEYRLEPWGLYMARATPGREQFHYLESWLLPAPGLRVSVFHFNSGFGRDQDYYLDVGSIAVDPDRWEIRDLYLDLVVRTGRGTDLVDVDELLEAHRGGLIDLVTAQQALLTAAAAIDGLASHGHDLDGWLSAAGMRLRWR